MKWFYFTNRKIDQVISNARRLIEISTPEPADEVNGDAAVPFLSEGGVIMLQRTLTKLEGIRDAQQYL
jgi:ubiquitin-conjugating enzyme E2 O